MKRILLLLLCAVMTLSSCGYQIVEESTQLPAEMLSELMQTDDEGRKAYVLAPAGEDAQGKTGQDNAQPAATPVPTPEPTPEPTPTPAPTPMILQNGSKGDEVKALQARLKVLGFLGGSADGTFGEATERAVKMAQQHLNDQVLKDIKEALASAQPTVQPTAQPTVQSTAQIASEPAPTPEVNLDGLDITLPYEVNGVVDQAFLTALNSEDFPVYSELLTNGSSGDQVKRLQNRLMELNYLLGSVDGSYGNGTAEAVQNFQRMNKLSQDGVAGEEVQKAIFSSSAIKSDRPPYPYVLKVSTKDQKVYAYGWGGDAYDQLVRTMVCSTGKNGTPTPKGTYSGASTGPGARWHYFKKWKCWAQYAYYIEGDIMFHSVLYNSKSENSLSKSSVRNLGRKASHGCVRLAVKDAKWIWQNCPAGTTIIVY